MLFDRKLFSVGKLTFDPIELYDCLPDLTSASPSDRIKNQLEA